MLTILFIKVFLFILSQYVFDKDPIRKQLLWIERRDITPIYPKKGSTLIPRVKKLSHKEKQFIKSMWWLLSLIF